MQLDLSAIHTATAAHTVAVQELLNSNASHAAAAKAAVAAHAAADAEVAAAQTELNTLASEVASQTAAIVAFNAANPA